MIKKCFLSVSLIVLICLSLTPIGCNSNINLDEYISDIRLNILEGQGEKYKVKLVLGEREDPYANDGVSHNRINYAIFTICNGQPDLSYTLKFDFENTNYSYLSSLSPINHLPMIHTQIENFIVDELNISITVANYREEIKLESIVPKNTMSYQKAIESFYNTESSLIANHTTENGKLNIEFYIRILVESEHPYWYIGIGDGYKVRAFLLDGYTLEPLASKDIY